MVICPHMAYLGDAIDAHLAAATGDDPALFRELRAAFVESARRQLDLLGRARCDGNWEMAALRLKSLAATFHAGDLIALADEALSGAPGEPAILRRIASALDSIEPTD
jgi:HPt (histidine-containing phosphotransfer) domain-containing protein